METLKNIWKKINPRAVVIGGVLVVTTSFGTCQLTRTEAVEPVVVEEVVVESLEDAPSADVQASEEEEVSSVE